jgi:polygalacturonase
MFRDAEGKNSRRRFLTAASTGVAAGALVSFPREARAESAADESHEGLFPVTHFGAKGDGKALDTDAINAAIDAASKAGGGIVLFPAGSYLSYSVHLKSNITLQLSPGATIVAAPGPEPGGEQGKYDLAESNAPWENYQDFGHNHWHNSLIWGEGLDNVAIVGRGLIWGKGRAADGIPSSPRPSRRARATRQSR